jgi:hypothetical protein
LGRAGSGVRHDRAILVLPRSHPEQTPPRGLSGRRGVDHGYCRLHRQVQRQPQAARFRRALPIFGLDAEPCQRHVGLKQFGIGLDGVLIRLARFGPFLQVLIHQSRTGGMANTHFCRRCSMSVFCSSSELPALTRDKRGTSIETSCLTRSICGVRSTTHQIFFSALTSSWPGSSRKQRANRWFLWSRHLSSWGRCAQANGSKP